MTPAHRTLVVAVEFVQSSSLRNLHLCAILMLWHEGNLPKGRCNGNVTVDYLSALNAGLETASLAGTEAGVNVRYSDPAILLACG